jgi:hypothetical protein
MALTDKIRFNYDDVYSAVLGLERRQQAFLFAGIITIAVIFVFLALYIFSGTISKSREDYEGHLDSAALLLGRAIDFDELQRSYGRLGDASSKLGTDPLNTAIYGLAEELGVKDNVAAVTTVAVPPSTSQFQEVSKSVTLKNVTLEKLIQFLDKLTRHDQLPMSIKKLNLKPDVSRKTMIHQAMVTVSSYVPSQSK